MKQLSEQYVYQMVSEIIACNRDSLEFDNHAMCAAFAAFVLGANTMAQRVVEAMQKGGAGETDG